MSCLYHSDLWSNWTDSGGGSPGGWLDLCWGPWDLYWKPLRKQDISDHREQDKQLKNDEKGRENGTLRDWIVIVQWVHVCVFFVQVACQVLGWHGNSNTGNGNTANGMRWLIPLVLLCENTHDSKPTHAYKLTSRC